MAISPDKAAEANDKRIEKTIDAEEARIDAILKKKHYTNGPAVELQPPTESIDDPVIRMIMERYSRAGWRIEVRPTGDTSIWRFTRL